MNTVGSSQLGGAERRGIEEGAGAQRFSTKGLGGIPERGHRGLGEATTTRGSGTHPIETQTRGAKKCIKNTMFHPPPLRASAFQNHAKRNRGPRTSRRALRRTEKARRTRLRDHDRRGFSPTDAHQRLETDSKHSTELRHMPHSRGYPKPGRRAHTQPKTHDGCDISSTDAHRHAETNGQHQSERHPRCDDS